MKSLSKTIRRIRLSGDTFHLDSEGVYALKPEELKSLVEEEKEMAYEEGKREGHRAGLREGIKRGKKQQYEELERSIQVAGQLLGEAQRGKDEIMRGAESELMGLATRIAEKIIQIEVKNKDVVKQLVKRAITQVVDKQNIDVRINPNDFDAVEGFKSKILASIKGIKELVVTKDPTVIEGGCLVVTDSGNIDAQIDSQLEEIRQSMNL